jgi:hypothetical protein
VCAELDVDIVHFLDDDVEILPGYLDAIEARFAADPGLSGAGGAVQNATTESHPWLNRFFLLSGRHAYTIRRSGRVVQPQPPGGARRDFVRPVEWLQGFSMSYRLSTLERHQFNERLEGYAFGEDREFGYRVSREGRLAIEQEAKCVHHMAAENRLDHHRHGRLTTLLTYAFVLEHREEGLSLLAFAWSVVGDLLRHGVLGAAALVGTGRRQSVSDSASHIRGILSGIGAIVANRQSPYRAQTTVK